MDAYIAQQPASSTGDTPGRSGGTGRRCVRFGCMEAAPGSSATLKAASCPPARPDLDVLLSDALARVPPDGSIRVEVWRA
jgi:hypothetical protein